MSNNSDIKLVASAINDLSTDMFVNLCSEIELTRNRISGITSAVSALVLPSYISAISLAVIAFCLFTK